MIYVTETSHLSGSARLSLFLIPRRALALWYNCTTGLFFFFFGVGRWWRWGVSMATGKLFRIICYLKTMRLFSNSRERGGASARFIWNLLDVLQMFCTYNLRPVKYSLAHLMQIRCTVLLQQMHDCSSFSRLDVLLIQAFYSLLLVLMFLFCCPAFRKIH